MVRKQISKAWKRLREDTDKITSEFFKQSIPIQVLVVGIFVSSIGVGFAAGVGPLAISLPFAIVIAANIMRD